MGAPHACLYATLNSIALSLVSAVPATLSVGATGQDRCAAAAAAPAPGAAGMIEDIPANHILASPGAIVITTDNDGSLEFYLDPSTTESDAEVVPVDVQVGCCETRVLELLCLPCISHAAYAETIIFRSYLLLHPQPLSKRSRS